MGNALWSGQAQNGVNSDFEVEFDHKGQGQLPTKTKGNFTKVFCIFGPNLAILAWTGPELSRGQASDWHTGRQTDRQTHTHTYAGNDHTRRPKLASGKNDDCTLGPFWWLAYFVNMLHSQTYRFKLYHMKYLHLRPKMRRLSASFEPRIYRIHRRPFHMRVQVVDYTLNWWDLRNPLEIPHRIKYRNAFWKATLFCMWSCFDIGKTCSHWLSNKIVEFEFEQPSPYFPASFLLPAQYFCATRPIYRQARQRHNSHVI